VIRPGAASFGWRGPVSKTGVETTDSQSEAAVTAPSLDASQSDHLAAAAAVAGAPEAVTRVLRRSGSCERFVLLSRLRQCRRRNDGGRIGHGSYARPVLARYQELVRSALGATQSRACPVLRVFTAVLGRAGATTEACERVGLARGYQDGVSWVSTREWRARRASPTRSQASVVAPARPTSPQSPTKSPALYGSQEPWLPSLDGTTDGASSSGRQ
jgi:hypothetical protein